jgi:N-acetylglutamate synthase-like GNAT family acetyltransferase
LTEIGPATRDDHAAIESLLRESDWGAVDLEVGEMLVARDDGEIVGVLRMGYLEPDGVFIDDVVVSPSRRGAGIGREMMVAAMDGPTGPFFLVCHDPRIAFYERLGFSVIEEADLPDGVRKHAYRTDQLPSHPGHVHHLMRRDRGPSL